MVLLCRNSQNTGVSLGGESIFSKVHKTSIFEYFTVEPELVQSTWNFGEDLLVCICSQENLFEKNDDDLGKLSSIQKCIKWGWCIIKGWMTVTDHFCHKCGIKDLT